MEKDRLIQAIAIVGLLATIFIAFVFLKKAVNHQRLQVSSSTVQEGSMVLVFALHDIEKGQTFQNSDVELKKVANHLCPQDCVWNPKMVLGKTSQCAILKGTMLRTTFFGIDHKELPEFSTSKWPFVKLPEEETQQ
ncbi:hypothetical protein BH11CYA1_BH11CYA1_09950 [soil metagenome]